VLTDHVSLSVIYEIRGCGCLDIDAGFCISSIYILSNNAGPCTKFKRIVDILDKSEKIDFISLTKADQEGLLHKFPAHQRYKSFHLISPKGDAKSGSEALLELIAILPGGKIISPIINNFPGGKKTVGFIYKRFSRLHDRGSCSINET
jgi:predicted DCC family thiol-disulfide oxidoreductase YuxK